MKHLLYIFLFFLPSLLWAQGYTIESQPVCWSYLSVDSSLVQYSLASSTATDTKILFYLNASGATVDISAGGAITFGLCNCGSGGSGSVVAINGLSNVSSDTIQLGGTQTANITINGDGFALSITGQDSIELVATARLRLNSVFFPRNDGFDGQTLVYDAAGDSLAWATISGENIYNADGAQTDQVRTDTLGGKTLVFDGRTGLSDTSTMIILKADGSTDDAKTTFLRMDTENGLGNQDSLWFYDYDQSFNLESSSNLTIIADNFLQLDTDSMFFSINGNYGNGPGTYFIDQRVAPRGIEYQSLDYIPTLSDSSLVPKKYVDDEISLVKNFVIQSTAPDTLLAWMDNSLGENQLWPVKRYINGAWQDLGYYDDASYTYDTEKPLTVVFAGQSNVTGTGQIDAGGYPPYDSTANYSTTVFNGYTRQWEVVDMDSSIYMYPYRNWCTTSPAHATILYKNAFGWAFAKKLARETGRRVRCIVNAFGANPIENWIGTDKPNWDTLLTYLNEAIVDTVDIVLWQQGESNLDTTSFYNKLDTLYQQFIGASWFSGVRPFLIGEVASTANNPINNTFWEYMNAHEWVSVARMRDLETYDGVHFTRDAHDQAGNVLFWEAYQNIPHPVGTWYLPSRFWSELNGNIYPTNSGNVGIGLTNPTVALQVSGDIQSNKIGLGKTPAVYPVEITTIQPNVMQAFCTAASGSATSGALVTLYENDGAAMSNGDRLGGVLFGGAIDASNNVVAATAIIGNANENWSSGVTGSRVAIETTPAGSSSRSSAFNFVGNLRFGLGVSAPNFDISFRAQTSDPDRTIGVENRVTSGTGKHLSINAGGTTGTNQNAGDLFLKTGASTGTGTGNIYFQTAGGGSSGSGNVTARTVGYMPGAGGLHIGNSGSFTAADGVVNALTGFRVNNSATSGNYLRGDGTNFVSSAIQASDIPVLNKINLTTGANTSMGTATLSGGTITVNTTAVNTASIIFVTCNTPGGTQGFLSVPSASIVNGTSFVINSSSGTDTSTVNWWIVN